MVYPHSYRTEHSETVTTNSTYGEFYRVSEETHISIQKDLLKLLQYVDSNRQQLVKDLNEAVQIKSVSGSLKYRNEVIKMIKFTETWLKRLGVKYQCFNYGYHELEGKKFRLPPIIMGSLGTDPKKRTLCVYGYLDVKEPDESKWQTDPWSVVDIRKVLYGCGTATGKFPLICWFHVILGLQTKGVELPVNLKFCFESMYQQDSEGLEEFLATRKQDFFFNVDFVVTCDSEWIGEKYPCLCYGSVGILHFEVIIEKKENSKTEIKDDMEKIFAHICDDEENILIPNFNNYVQQITPDEETIYENIQDFDPEEVIASLPPYKQHWDKVNLLMHFWRLPSIFVDDIEECICDKKDFSKIKRHFIIKIVPRQVVDHSVAATIKHVNNVVKELKIENKVECKVLSASRPWYEDFRSPNYEAARRATIQIYKEDPNMIREDRDRKVLNILQRITEKSILLLPLVRKGSNPGEENENNSLRNFFEGTKLLGAYIFQLALCSTPPTVEK